MRRSYCLRDTLIWTLIIYFIFIAAVFLFNIIFSDVIRHSSLFICFRNRLFRPFTAYKIIQSGALK